MTARPSKRSYVKELLANGGYKFGGLIFYGIATGLVGAGACYMISLMYYRAGIDLPPYIPASLLGSIYVYTLLFFVSILLRIAIRPRLISFYEFSGRRSEKHSYTWLDGHEIATRKIVSAVVPTVVSYLIGTAVILGYSILMGFPLVQNYVIALVLICSAAIALIFFVSLTLSLIFKDFLIEFINVLLATALVHLLLYFCGFYNFKTADGIISFITSSSNLFGLSFLTIAAALMIVCCVYVILISENRQNENKLEIITENYNNAGLILTSGQVYKAEKNDVKSPDKTLQIAIIAEQEKPEAEDEFDDEPDDLEKITTIEIQTDDTMTGDGPSDVYNMRTVPVLDETGQIKTVGDRPQRNTDSEDKTMSEFSIYETTDKATEMQLPVDNDVENTEVKSSSSDTQTFTRPAQQQTIQASIQRRQTATTQQAAQLQQRIAAQKAAQQKRAAEAAEKQRAAVAQSVKSQKQRIAAQQAAQRERAIEIQKKLAEMQAAQRAVMASSQTEQPVRRTASIGYNKAATEVADASKVDFFQIPALDGMQDFTTEVEAIRTPEALASESYDQQENACQMPDNDSAVIDNTVDGQDQYEAPVRAQEEPKNTPEYYAKAAAEAALYSPIPTINTRRNTETQPKKKAVAEPEPARVEKEPVRDTFIDELEPDADYEYDKVYKPKKKGNGAITWLIVIPLMIVFGMLLAAFGLAAYVSFTGGEPAAFANVVFNVLFSEKEAEFLWVMGANTYGLAYLGVMFSCFTAIFFILLGIGINFSRRD